MEPFILLSRIWIWKMVGSQVPAKWSHEPLVWQPPCGGGLVLCRVGRAGSMASQSTAVHQHETDPWCQRHPRNCHGVRWRWVPSRALALLLLDHQHTILLFAVCEEYLRHSGAIHSIPSPLQPPHYYWVMHFLQIVAPLQIQSQSGSRFHILWINAGRKLIVWRPSLGQFVIYEVFVVKWKCVKCRQMVKYSFLDCGSY